MPLSCHKYMTQICEKIQVHYKIKNGLLNGLLLFRTEVLNKSNDLFKFRFSKTKTRNCYRFIKKKFHFREETPYFSPLFHVHVQIFLFYGLVPCSLNILSKLRPVSGSIFKVILTFKAVVCSRLSR